jgi:hypothetical protein
MTFLLSNNSKSSASGVVLFHDLASRFEILMLQMIGSYTIAKNEIIGKVVALNG